MTKQKWNTQNYQRIISAEIKGERLVVNFADETFADLPYQQLMISDTQTTFPETVEFSDYEVSVSTPSGVIEIPWSTIRLLSDSDFASHWANQAEQQAKQVGLQLRELRRRRNLSSKDVAERAGITPQSLSRIERGHHNVVFTTLQRILSAMGCTLQDLVDAQTSAQSLGAVRTHLESAGVKQELRTNTTANSAESRT